MTNESSDNIIQFSTFQEMYDQNSANKCFKEYLEALSFSELINESNLVMHELKSGKIDKDLTTKSRLILKEFEKRTGANKKLTKMRSETEDKIINLEDHL